MTKQELVWQTLDQQADNGPANELIARFQEAKGALERCIEQAMGGPCQFSYRRGEISFARVARSPAKGKVGLAEYLSSRGRWPQGEIER